MKITNWKKPFFSKLLTISVIIIAFSSTISQNVLAKEQTSNIEPANPWLFLHSYQAEYSVISEGELLGYSSRKLTQINQRWLLNINSEISKYLLKLKNNESTEFHFDKQQLLTDRFYSRTKMTFKKAKIMEQQFDWENKIENGSRKGKKWQLKLESQVFDRASHIFQLRSDLLAGKKNFSYKVSYKGKLREYSYIIEKKETIETKMGKLSTIKLNRNKSNGDIFSIWLSPELNYFPVKIAQYEKDKPDVTLLLKSLGYDQQP